MLAHRERPVPRNVASPRTLAAAAAVPFALLMAIGLSAVPVKPVAAFGHDDAPAALAAWVPDFSCGSPPAAHQRDATDRGSSSTSWSGSLSHASSSRSADARDGRIHGRLGRLHQAVTTGRFRTGSGVRVQCVGAPRRSVHPVTWRLRLEQLERVDTLNGERSLTAFEQRYALVDSRDERRTTGSLVAEVITLPNADHWRASADGTSLRASQAGRRAGAVCPGTATGRCSTSSLIDWRLGGTEQHPELVQTRYIGGVASDAVLWRLGR